MAMGESNPTIPPPNEKCEKYVEKMKTIFYMQLLLGFVNLFLGTIIFYLKVFKFNSF
jgi:hypothetical protein